MTDLVSSSVALKLESGSRILIQSTRKMLKSEVVHEWRALQEKFLKRLYVPKAIGKLVGNTENDIENREKLGEKLGEKRVKLTKNRIAILRLIAENPYITQSDLAKTIGVSLTAIENNIEFMRGKYIRRVGPDKGGFWEIIDF